MSKIVKQIIILAVFVIIVGLGASLTMKAAIGIGAYDAASMSLSKALYIKVGNIGMCLNITCIVMQILILRQKFKPIQFLQIGVAVLIGMAINFFFYTVFGWVYISNYILRILLLIVGYVVCAFGVSVVMAINIVSLPLEGFCLVVSNKFKWNFGKVRQSADIVLIVIIVIVTLLFRIEFTLREGTIIGMIIFGPMLNVFMSIIKPILVKYDVIVFNREDNDANQIRV